MDTFGVRMASTRAGTRSLMAPGSGTPATDTPGYPDIRGDGCRTATAAGSMPQATDRPGYRVIGGDGCRPATAAGSMPQARGGCGSPVFHGTVGTPAPGFKTRRATTVRRARLCTTAAVVDTAVAAAAL